MKQIVNDTVFDSEDALLDAVQKNGSFVRAMELEFDGGHSRVVEQWGFMGKDFFIEYDRRVGFPETGRRLCRHYDEVPSYIPKERWTVKEE